MQLANLFANREFKTENAEVDWTLSEPFGSIHCRILYPGIYDWPRHFSRCFD